MEKRERRIKEKREKRQQETKAIPFDALKRKWHEKRKKRKRKAVQKKSRE